MKLSTNKTLFELCLPLFLHSLIGFSVLLLDMMIISAYSEQAAAAVNIANQVLLVAYEFSMLLGVGGSILIAQALGRNEHERARQIASVAIIANTVFSGVISVLVWVLAEPILALAQTPPEIFADALLYVQICGGTLALNGLMLATNLVLRGFGLTQVIFILGVFSQSFYLAMEYVLILGFGPIEGMGVLGSALGTLALRVVACSLLIVLILRRLKLPFKQLNWSFAQIKSQVKSLFKLSFPSVSDNMAYGLYQLILLGFIAGMGVATVLARGYTLLATAFYTVIIMVVSQGTEVLLGFQVGAKNYTTAYWRALRSALIAVVLATAISTLFYLFAPVYIGLFTADEEVHRIAYELLFLSIFLQPVFAFNAILFNALKAVGDVNWPVIVSQGITWCLSLPAAYVVVVIFDYSVAGIWYVMIVEESLKSLMMMWRWQSGKWRLKTT